MDRDKLVARLTATFLEELEEHVRVFNRELLALEQQPSEPSAERIKTLFRSAHSLKGAARAVSAARVEAICHRLEGVLAQVRDGTRAPTPELFELLFAAADAIDHAGKLFAGEVGLEHEMVVRSVLDRLNVAHAASSKPPAQTPFTEPLRPPIPREFASPREPASRPLSRDSSRAIETREAPPSSRRSSPPIAQRADGNGNTNGNTNGHHPRPSEPPSAQVTAVKESEPQQESSSVKGAGTPADTSHVVRVRGSKLDTLLAQSGELLIARRRLEGRRHQIAGVLDFVARWRAEWRAVDKALTRRTRRARAAEEPGNPGGAADLGLPLRAERALLRTHEYLRRLERDLEHLALSAAEDHRAIDRAASPLEEQIRQVRMLPVQDACESLFRVVRDLAAAQNKDVALVIEHGDTEVDRTILDGLRDPLIHLVRNAIDHGIEPPALRAGGGKSARATIVVSAEIRGNAVEIAVADDGRGLDLGAIRSRARERHIAYSDDPAMLARLIFSAGFSTAPMITEVSGRGVGLDVVKTQVERLRGTVAVTSEPGRGTRFCLTLPLTLTTMRALLVETGGLNFALPSASVERLVRIDASVVSTIEGREVARVGGAPLPLASLSKLFGLPARPQGSSARAAGAILSVDGERAVLLIDEFVTEQEIVLKSLGPRLRRMKFLSGATVLPSGRVAPVLDAREILREVVAKSSTETFSRAAVGVAGKAPKRLILADDSVTTRTLEKSILEAAGYEVLTASDGSAAWHLLQDKGADLVVSDVEMPKMDGFSLTETIRGSKRFRALPVILVTALESDSDRARGLEAGADAYLPKSTFDQKALLETIRQLL